MGLRARIPQRLCLFALVILYGFPARRAVSNFASAPLVKVDEHGKVNS